MNRRTFIAGLAGTAVAGCVTASDRDDRLAAAARIVREQLAAGSMKGCAFGTDGAVRAAGLRTFSPDETPLAPDCCFDVASLTKPLVAATLARLAADGQFDPEAPFTRYLPGHVLGANCELSSVDLATHASGFENLEGLKEGLSRFPDRALFLQRCLALKPVAPRRARYCYCCQNYIYLGLIAEEITGQPLDVACRELVLTPLGMKETFWGPCADVSRVVQQPPAFVNTPNALGEINDERAARCAFPIGNAGVFSTAGDLLAFATDLARRERFPSAYYDLLGRPAFRGQGKVRSFGFDLTPDPLLPAASPQAIRHSGFTGQTLLADPATGRAAVVLTSRNCAHGEGLRLRNRIVNKLIGG